MLNRMISSVLAAACIWLAIALARSGGPSAPPAAPAVGVGPAPNVDPVDEEHRLLDRPIGDLHFDQTALNEVVEAISTRAKVTLYVRWKSLEGAGIDRTAPVSLNLRNVSLRQALVLLEDWVGGDTARLAHFAVNGVVTISTADDAEKFEITEIYDVRDLLDEMMAMDSAQVRKMGAAADRTTRTYFETVELLVWRIYHADDPESWDQARGSVASMDEFCGLLFITQTPEHHRGIRQKLGKMREAVRRHEPLPATRPESPK